jgi:hypothetical protein
VKRVILPCFLVLRHNAPRGPVAQLWSERTPDKREVGGSSPPWPIRLAPSALAHGKPFSRGECRACPELVEGSEGATCGERAQRVEPSESKGRQQVPVYGAVAQLGERRPCKAEVEGSNPFCSILPFLQTMLELIPT